MKGPGITSARGLGAYVDSLAGGDRDAGLSGQFNSSTPRLKMLYYKNRTARYAKDLWAAAVVLAAEDSWRYGERGNVALQAAAALVLASGDAWLVGGAP